LINAKENKELYLFDEIIQVVEEKLNKAIEEKLDNFNISLLEKTKIFKNKLKIFSFYVFEMIFIYFLEKIEFCKCLIF
jgi:hypothetical protein